MPIYKVTDTATGEVEYINAKRVEQAINTVVDGRFEAERIDIKEAVHAKTGGAFDIESVGPVEATEPSNGPETFSDAPGVQDFLMGAEVN